jgi:hypothetical protein
MFLLYQISFRLNIELTFFSVDLWYQISTFLRDGRYTNIKVNLLHEAYLFGRNLLVDNNDRLLDQIMRVFANEDYSNDEMGAYGFSAINAESISEPLKRDIN